MISYPYGENFGRFLKNRIAKTCKKENLSKRVNMDDATEERDKRINHTKS